MRRAGLYRFQGDEQRALDDVQDVLNSSEATYFDVRLAVRMLYDMDRLRLNQIPTSRALATLDFDERCAVAHELLWSHDTIPAAETILTEVIENRDTSDEQRQEAKNELALGYIARGRFREAMHAISPTRLAPSEFNIRNAFNYAMAEWGATGAIPHDLLQRVVDLDKQSPLPDRGPNYMQCLAIAHWAVGNIEQAREKISRARQQLMARRSPDFSAWRYLIVPVDQFMADLDAMLKMINGEKVVPMFMAQDASERQQRGQLMIEPASLSALSNAIHARINTESSVLTQMRDDIRQLKAATRRIHPRSATAISLVGTDGGNNQIHYRSIYGSVDSCRRFKPE